MTTQLRRRRGLSLGCAALILGLDQWSKAWAIAHLHGQFSRPFLPGLLEFQLTSNTGAAFSLFTGSSGALGLVSVVVALGVVLWLLRQRQLSLWRSLAAGLVLGGALGNGIDRWRLGAVTDFLALVPVRFPVFNLADMAINAAVICLVIDLLRPAEAP